MNPIQTEKDLDDSFRHGQRAAVINAWASLGLFEELANGEPRRLEELPGDARALRVTARILAHAGLLVHRDGRYRLSASAQRLVEEGVLSRNRSLDPFAGLARLGELMQEGGPLPDENGEKKGTSIGVRPDQPEATRGFLRMLHRRSAEVAIETARWIDDALDGAGRILDLGGGHGRYGAELAKLGHDVTLFDLEVSTRVAREINGDDLSYLDGDFFVDDLGGPYDVVLVSNIIHGLSPGQNLDLFERVAEVLAPGGLFVIKDMFLDEYGQWPTVPAFFGLTMLMFTEEGDCYRLEEVAQWLREAGLKPEPSVVLEAHALLFARK